MMKTRVIKRTRRNYTYCIIQYKDNDKDKSHHNILKTKLSLTKLQFLFSCLENDFFRSTKQQNVHNSTTF